MIITGIASRRSGVQRMQEKPNYVRGFIGWNTGDNGSGKCVLICKIFKIIRDPAWVRFAYARWLLSYGLCKKLSCTAGESVFGSMNMYMVKLDCLDQRDTLSRSSDSIIDPSIYAFRSHLSTDILSDVLKYISAYGVNNSDVI